jgi:uncharacterized membrane protein
MTNTNSTTVPIKNERLKFIDMARSIAILLMLQGHFITLTYFDYETMHHDLNNLGDSGSMWFNLFDRIRGFTAPLFFSITGLVFVYLLAKPSSQTQKVSFFKIERVQKGIKRAFTILIWAYFIQINLKYTKYYLRGHVPQELLTFHILQSISIGILVLLLIYGLHKLIKRGSLIFYYFIAGVTVFYFHPYFFNLPKTTYFPSFAPEIIQNMFHGPKSQFPLFPSLGFVLFGGMFGSMLQKYQVHFHKKWFPYATMLFAGMIFYFGRYFAKINDYITDYDFNQRFEKCAWVYGRLAEVVLLLSVLMIIEKTFKIKENLFLKIGQNTLPIYILHVIILSGAVFGISVKTYYKHNLSAFQSIIGAIAFILFFVLFIKYIETINGLLSKLKNRIKKLVIKTK